MMWEKVSSYHKSCLWKLFYISITGGAKVCLVNQSVMNKSKNLVEVKIFNWRILIIDQAQIK